MPHVSIDPSAADDRDAPLARYPLRHDPLTTQAVEEIAIGDRTLLAVSDGFLTIENHPQFLGTPEDPHAFHDLMVAQGHSPARMPLGAFIWPGERTLMIDTGFGRRDLGGGTMVGGQLPLHMRDLGLTFDDIDDIALSHLHPDHTGWLADLEGRPLFRRARVHVGRADWEHFMTGPDGPGRGIDQHVAHALTQMADQGRVTLLDGDSLIAPGVTRLSGPGHTPGHSLFVVHDGGERALLFGDAVYCPQQLTNTDWAASSDVDPVAARRTREAGLRELETGGGLALGCHFPGLRAGRVLGGAWQPLR